MRLNNFDLVYPADINLSYTRKSAHYLRPADADLNICELTGTDTSTPGNHPPAPPPAPALQRSDVA